MLLFDLAHANIAARELALDVREFVEDHPLHRLCELHVAGVGETKPAHP